MSKFFKNEAKENKEVSADVQSVLNVVETPKYTRNMIGTFIDPVTNEWKLAYIGFDPKTLQVSEVKTERVAGNYQVMVERLQIKQSTLGLLEDGDFAIEKKVTIY